MRLPPACLPTSRHLVVGNLERGAHLALSLERPDALAGRPPHPHRPSAGYSPPTATARYLADGECRSGITG